MKYAHFYQGASSPLPKRESSSTWDLPFVGSCLTLSCPHSHMGSMLTKLLTVTSLSYWDRGRIWTQAHLEFLKPNVSSQNQGPPRQSGIERVNERKGGLCGVLGGSVSMWKCFINCHLCVCVCVYVCTCVCVHVSAYVHVCMCIVRVGQHCLSFLWHHQPCVLGLSQM